MSTKRLHGELHTTDAHTGLPVPLFYEGTNNPFIVQGDDVLIVESVQIIASAGGDVQLFASTSAVPSPGDMIVRGSLGTGSGVVESKRQFKSRPGASLVLIAPVGIVDVIVSVWVGRPE
jgi:hypothetical protein